MYNGDACFADISQIMARSRDWDELQYVWTEWRRRSGMRIKDLYQQLVTLNNEAARLNSRSMNDVKAGDYAGMAEKLLGLCL